MGKRDDWKPLSAVLTAEQLDGLAEDWAAFVERTGTADRDLFVQYLHQQGLVTADQLAAALKIRVQPEVSDVAAMDRRARGEEEGVARTYAEMSPAGHYALLGRVGEGAMGEIWVGKDHDLKRKVAYKELAEKLQGEPAIRQRFLAEAQITAQLDHPGVVPVYGFEAGADGRLGYGMKLVEGRDLRAVVAAADTRLLDRLELFLKICEAVAYAHSRGVLHRDLKPENIMVGAYGEVYVMDWGLARVTGQPDPTRAGHAVGTPAYMSPEQALAQNEKLDARSDQYALGLILQELVTLAAPVPKASSTDEALRTAIKGTRVPMNGGPAAVRAIVARACSPSRDQRYADVAALASDVRAFLRDEPVHALREGPIRAVWRGLVRYREAVLALGLLFVVAGALVAVGSVTAISVGAIAQQQREERLGQAIADLGEQAHAIDKEILRYERMLEVVAGSSGHLLSSARPTVDFQIYQHDAFDDLARRPPDTAPSPRYGKDVSLVAPVFKLAPGVDPDDPQVFDILEKLVRLRSDLRRIVVPDDQRTTPPVGWVYVGTETGVHMSFPGHGGYAASFDPRQRPWYLQARDRDGHVWGKPYVDEGGLGLVVPCSRRLRGSDGSTIGVAGIDVTLNHLIDEMLAPDSLPISRAFLLDGDGGIVVSSDDREQEVESPVPFPDPIVLDRVKAGQSASLRQDDGSWLLVYPLHALGWAYVVEASEVALVGAG